MQAGLVYTEKDYLPQGTQAELVDPCLFKNSEFKQDINISAENFVVEVMGNVSLADLDQALGKEGLESTIIAPANYSISRILAENWDNNCKKACLGLELSHIDQKQSKTGGRVIKNVSGFDLAKIYIGSYNSLAIISGAYLRVDKRPEAQSTLTYKLNGLTEDLKQFRLDMDDVYPKIIKSHDIDGDHYQVMIKITGDQDLAKLRAKKIQNKLGKADNESNSEYQGKNYPASQELTVELNCQITDLYYFANIFDKQCPKLGYEIDIEQGQIKLRANDIDELANDFANCKQELLAQDYHLNIFPINYQNCKVKGHINYHRNSYEQSLMKQIKQVYDREQILNPGILNHG